MSRKAKKVKHVEVLDNDLNVIDTVAVEEVPTKEKKEVEVIVLTDAEKKELEGMTISSQIRHLHIKYTRGQIARILNKRYQHVRNVLETPLKKQGTKK